VSNGLARVDRLVQLLLLPLTLGGLVLGIAAAVAGQDTLAWWAWTVPSVIVGIWLVASIVRDLLHHQAGVDVIAVLAIGGALLLGESLAAAVIGVMLATGDWLERFANRRAHRELSALVSRAPRVVHRHQDGGIADEPIEVVEVGDRLLVKPGEVIPVDGTVIGSVATLDESALTGESRVVTREEHEVLSSGAVNAGMPFDLLATATAEHSTYAGIVRLVEEAQSSKAPFVRLADRYALLFVPLALGIAGAAWALSGDPVRALAVLVVATPCPLLLAAPIAIVAGISRSARRGIIIKGGGALETLARARAVLFDKTGTLTAGRPHVAGVATAPGQDPDEVLRWAASLEQVSPHVLAASIVAGARERGLALALPEGASENAGAGVSGRVDGRIVRVGTAEFAAAGGVVPPWARDVRRRVTLDGATGVYVAANGTLVGALVLDDPVRPESPRVIRALRRAGVRRIVMVTGDHYGVADLVGAAIGADAVLAERTPADKVEAVVEERENTDGVLVMVGDGINDAPALAAADVGVAMGARGATASSEAADVVITVDRLDRLPEAIGIAGRSRSIALQSVLAGMGMSIVAMLIATTGVLSPVVGAIIQELIDVAVILNALRALSGGVERVPDVPGWPAIGARLHAEHRELAKPLTRIRSLADGLGAMPPLAAGAELVAVRQFLDDTLVPHEELEDREVFPLLTQALGNDDVTAALHRTHTEIFHLVRMLGRMVDELGPPGPASEDLPDLRRVLYGLDAILRLHMAQEEELYLTLGDGSAPATHPVAQHA
jgi:heavy metal translocating P-type ATPase